VIGMALLRDRTITEVAQSLVIDGDRRKPVTDSAVVQARARLGKNALEWLFAHSASTWAHRSAAADRFKGLALYGLDGTSLRVPDSPDEYGYADALWNELPDNSLCIVDRGFFSARLLLRLHDSSKNRHWLIRTRERMQLSVRERLGPGDGLVEVPVSPEARQKDPTLPLTYVARLIEYQRKGFKPQRLLTSLVDARRYPRDAVAALYHERWELELGYDEIKTDLLDRRESIRSKTPDGIEQEIWGLLLAYNLVRVYMERVAKMAKLPPLRISFITALRFIREEWYFDSLPAFSPGSLPRHMQRLAEQLCRFILPERRSGRSYPREVKIKMSNYPRKRR